MMSTSSVFSDSRSGADPQHIPNQDLRLDRAASGQGSARPPLRPSRRRCRTSIRRPERKLSYPVSLVGILVVDPSVQSTRSGRVSGRLLAPPGDVLAPEPRRRADPSLSSDAQGKGAPYSEAFGRPSADNLQRAQLPGCPLATGGPERGRTECLGADVCPFPPQK